MPGGCNQEFDVETSPFIRLYEDPIQTRLDFQLSRLGAPAARSHSCDISRSFIYYEVYSLFLREGDFSEDELFRGLRLMSEPSSITRYGSKIHSFASSRRTRVFLLSYPGRGVVYNVLAVSQQTSAAYVPVSSYNCDLRTSIVGCGKMNEIMAVILLCILSVTGLIVTFRGHQWFGLQVAWSAYLVSLIAMLIVLSKCAHMESTNRQVVALVASIGASLIWFSMWRYFKKQMISVLTSGLLLGFLIIATVLFSTLGNEELFRSELNYWIILGAGSVVIPVILMPFGILLSIFSCSVVGSYSVVFAFDRLIGGSLSFIVLNVLKRAAFSDVPLASNQVPFQKKDIALAATWVILAVIGLVTQLYMSTRVPRRQRRRSQSQGVRLTRRLRSRSGRRRSSSSRSRSAMRRNSRSRSLRPTAPPSELAAENQPLIAEAAPIVYSAI